MNPEELERIRVHTDLIVALSKNNAIGRNGELLVSIREDLARFRRLTLGGILIYGRKTMETFPGQKPLEGRFNAILSRSLSPDTFTSTEAQVFPSLDALSRFLLDRLESCEPGTEPCVHIVGGAEIYRQLIPWAGSLQITHLDQVYEDADAFLEPELFEGFTRQWNGPWRRAGKKRPFGFRYEYYTRGE